MNIKAINDAIASGDIVGNEDNLLSDIKHDIGEELDNSGYDQCMISKVKHIIDIALTSFHNNCFGISIYQVLHEDKAEEQAIYIASRYLSEYIGVKFNIYRSNVNGNQSVYLDPIISGWTIGSLLIYRHIQSLLAGEIIHETGNTDLIYQSRFYISDLLKGIILTYFDSLYDYTYASNIIRGYVTNHSYHATISDLHNTVCISA